MKKTILLAFVSALVIAITSCTSPYGKKVKINDTLEVYVKGENVADSDAHKLGNYLADLWKGSDNEKSLQLSKENSHYVVKMVVDEEKLKTDTTLIAAFDAMQFLLEEEVFKGQKVKFVLTDDRLHDIRTIEGPRVEPETDSLVMQP